MSLNDEFQEFKEAFLAFDVNGTGKINKKDIMRIMQSLGLQVSANVANEVVTDENDQVDLPELLTLFARKMKGEDEKSHLANAFKVFDHDGSGQISVD